MTDFVLIHGAGTGGWLWDELAARLRGHGHVVHAPTLIGVGERIAEGGPGTDVSTHVADVVRLVEQAGIGKAVLVGFSYGGVVIAGVAEAIPERVAELVFLDAFVPEPGRCLFDLFPPALRASMESSAEDGWRLAPAPLPAVGGIGKMEPGIDENEVLTVLARRGPHPIGTYSQLLDTPFRRAADIPRRYISCTEKADGDPLIAIAEALRAAGWLVQDLPTGHFAMLTMPTRLSQLVEG